MTGRTLRLFFTPTHTREFIYLTNNKVKKTLTLNNMLALIIVSVKSNLRILITLIF